MNRSINQRANTVFDISWLTSFLHDHKTAFWWIAVGSGFVFFASLILVPWLAVRIPADYFATNRRPRMQFADEHPLLRWTGLILKNIVGWILVLAGLAMILLPGQGLLTIAIGVVMLDFPGKHNLESKIIRQKPIAKSIHWLRKKAGVEPLQLDTRGDEDHIK